MADELSTLASNFAQAVGKVQAAKAAHEAACRAEQTKRDELTAAVDVAQKAQLAMSDHVDTVVPDINRK